MPSSTAVNYLLPVDILLSPRHTHTHNPLKQTYVSTAQMDK